MMIEYGCSPAVERVVWRCKLFAQPIVRQSLRAMAVFTILVFMGVGGSLPDVHGSEQGVPSNAKLVAGQAKEIVVRDNPISSVYRFNSQGQVIEEVAVLNEKSKDLRRDWRVVYSYRRDGKLQETMSYLKNGSLLRRGTYWYDDAGNLSVRVSTLGDGSVGDASFYSYDNRNNLLASTDLHPDRNVWSILYIRQSGEVKEISSNSKTAQKSELRKFFDEAGRVNRVENYNNGELVDETLYRYDKHGNETEKIVTAVDGKLMIKSVGAYEYDELGNWTKLSRRYWRNHDGELALESTDNTERDITYLSRPPVR